MAAASMEIDKTWIADTLDRRKRDVRAIAPAVVKAIAER
jgi:hypothetical protein